MNFYPHHIKDFNNSTRHLTRVERSVYRDAIELYYDTESVLTKDFDTLSRRLLCVTDDEKKALESVLIEFFNESDDGYSHERCDIEILKYRSNTSAKAKAGVASAAKRKQNSTHVQQSDTVCSTNQEPVTSNQEPITINKKNNPAKADKFVFVLPEWIDKQKWDLWQKTRKGKKMLPEQMQAQVEKLRKWKDAGMDYSLALAESADNGWTGLFEPKQKMPGRVNGFSKQPQERPVYTLQGNRGAIDSTAEVLHDSLRI